MAALLLVGAVAGVRAEEAEPRAGERPRLIVLKVDGLSPLLVDALMNPDDPEKLNRLTDPEGFRRAVALVRLRSGQQELLPNLRRYFYEQGVVAEQMFSATTTLSSIAWGVIDTGQPSIVKRHMTFNRNNGFLRSHLDGFRDTMEFSLRRGRKTNALWELDQAGVSLFADAFQPLRRYETPQIYYRLTPRDYLVGLAEAYGTAGKPLSNPWGIVRGYLVRQVEGMDYPDFAEDYVASHLAEKILEPGVTQGERYDYLTTLFTVDHQQHVDPNPENLVHRLVRLDRRIGRILRAVERSRRREATVIALLSDHGSEYEPPAIHLTFPLTRIFRTRYFGGHTAATVMAEDSGRALTTPIPGVDYPRVYESPFSPYGRGAGGESGYPTAFIDNFGNSRAEVHLRHNDLNRLHLLLARRRKLEEENRQRLRERLQETLGAVREWLEPELALYRDYTEAVRSWLPNLKQRRDPYWRDAAARLEAENELDRAQVRALGRLAELCQAADPLAWLEERNPSVSDLIPKKYFGPRNSVFQLRHYTIGLDDNVEWVETTVDQQGWPAPMDYIYVLSHYRAPNPPLSQEPNPVDVIVRSLPVEAVQAALRERGWRDNEVELRQAIWIVSTAQHNRRKGGEALLLEATDGRLRYMPIRNLEETGEGRIVFETHNELDPLGLLYDPGFRVPEGVPAFWWLEGFHSRRAWLEAVADTYYTSAPLIFADIAGFHADAFLENPEFRRTLAGFPSEEMKQRYLRGLRWKYASQQPDLLLWSSYLWNFSSKSQTSGGSHGGLTERVTRTAFMLWGGGQFGLPAGTRIEEPVTTLDIAPTLARLLGMLDEQGRVVRQPGAVRERPFLPFAGEPLPVGEPFLARPAEPLRPVARTAGPAKAD
ncbi:MAG: alkaline phosphatase family protein [Acidobacteria bacterium]|nr:alkaline phosphatase family protein [Acidobacteriota bacterium]